MNEVAAHLAASVVPPVGTRQWVLTLPYALRYRSLAETSSEPSRRKSLIPMMQSANFRY